MKSLKQLLDDKKGVDRNKYISREYQDYGVRLAMELGDEEHKSLYIMLAKKEKRERLERARSFAIDSSASKRGALFMWKLGELRKGQLS